MVDKDKDKDKEKILYTSFYKIGKTLAEQCYDGNKSFFAVWDGHSVSYEDNIFDAIKIKPLYGEEIIKKAIKLPTKAEEYGSDEELDKEISDFITKWLDIPDDVRQFAIWNIKRSWVYDKFHTLNYLRALGDTGVGKTRFLDVLGQIHYKPLATSGATTAAPIFRIIEKWHGTLIMDEADFSKSDEAQDIIKIINMGYEKDKYILRCDRDNNNKIDFFDPYGPKILATRKSFTDKAVEGRCITQVMQETTRKDIPYNLNDEFFETTQRLRNKLLMWRFKHFDKIKPNTNIDLGLDIEPRVKQIVNSFVTLFGDNNKDIEKFKVFIKEYQGELIDERKSSWAGTIIGVLHELLQQGVKDISNKDIIEKGNLTNSSGNPMHPMGLNNQLKSLGFKKSISKKVDGFAKRCIPINQQHIDNLFKRYGYAVTLVTLTMPPPQITIEQDIEQNEGLGGHRIQRNLRNGVTSVMDVKTVKDTLISQFTMTPEIEVQQFLTRYPDQFHTSIEVLIDNLKSDGDIMESRPGFIKLL